VGYIKTSFLEGRSFSDLDDLNRQLEVWLDTVANVRVHGTTRERPVDRHAGELPDLRRFAAVPAYDVRPLEFRQVPSDCHISYHAVAYSVDPRAVGRSVSVRAEGENVGDAFSVYLAEELVARHRRRRRGSGRVTLPEHAEAIRRLTRGNGLKARRRRGAQPRFVQLGTSEETLLLDRIHRGAPAVEVRPLEVYERLVAECAP
jgi:hypothetical protein